MRGRTILLLVLCGLPPLGCGGAIEKEIPGGSPGAEGPDDPGETTEGRLVFTPKRLDFGLVHPGSEVRRRVAVQNVGEAALSLHSIDLSSPFHMASESLSLAPGATHEFSIAFAPLQEGEFESMGGFATDDHRLFHLEVVGQGRRRPSLPNQPQLWVVPKVLDFGEVSPAVHAGALSLDIHNVSEERAEITLSLSSSAFSVHPDALALEAGEREKVEVGLSLGGVGDHEATLSIRPCPSCTAILVPVLVRAESH